MARHESKTELAGQLAASLTPRLHEMPLQQAGAQNSGLFDISAMYAASVEQVMRRAQKARPAVAIHATLGAPIGHYPQPRYGEATYEQGFEHVPQQALEQYEDVDLAAEYAMIPGLRRRGQIGWFAIGVAWLATATLAAGISTMVPAHGLKWEVVPVVTAAAAAAQMPPDPVQAALPVASLPIVAPPALAPVAPPAPTTTAIATVTQAMNQAALPTVAAAAPKPHAVAVRPHPVTRTASSDALASAPAATAGVAVARPAAPTDSEPAVKPAPPKPAVAAAPAAGGSLEDLIRQAVAADAAKKH
jgi:hypothetical protein